MTRSDTIGVSDGPSMPRQGRSDRLGDDRPGPSDAELIAAVRGGDSAAYAELYRRHTQAAYALARQLASSPSSADDLVAEAFAKVLETLRQGRGPDSAFRAYLLTTLRHGLYDSSRRDKRLLFSDDLSAVDPGTPFEDTPMRELEASLVARAYAALPERWQTVLWHTEIEGQRPADVAPLLGLTANGAAALAYRAREGLRQAYLQAHLAESAEGACRYTVERLGAWARDGLAKRERARVQEHLDECERCRALSGELVDVNSGLRAIIAPLVLGAPFAAGYLASLGAVGTGAAGTAGAAAAPGAAAAGTGPAGTGPAGTARSRRTVALAAASAAAVLAGVAAAAFALTRSGDDGAQAGAPAGGSASASAPAGPTGSSGPSADPSAPDSQPPAGSDEPGSSPTVPRPSPVSPSPAGPSPAGPSPAGPPAAGPPAAGAPGPADGQPSGPAGTDEPVDDDVGAPPPGPALVPLAVSVRLEFSGAGVGESGTLSGAVGATPQIRLLDAVPPGWTVAISGPCAEGPAATTVCTLPGAQGATSVSVAFTPPASPAGSPTVRIGLFRSAGDAAPVDSF